MASSKEGNNGFQQTDEVHKTQGGSQIQTQGHNFKGKIKDKS